MPFEKGFSGNPDGRPKGAINKTGAQLRESITGFLEKTFPQVVNDFKMLKPKERVKLFCELLQYSVPKLQSVQLETDFERLPDDQLDIVIEKIIQSANEPERKD